jgi:hypothetical protein
VCAAKCYQIQFGNENEGTFSGREYLIHFRAWPFCDCRPAVADSRSHRASRTFVREARSPKCLPVNVARPFRVLVLVRVHGGRLLLLQRLCTGCPATSRLAAKRDQDWRSRTDSGPKHMPLSAP